MTVVRAVALAFLPAPAALAAQTPGLPVLQNAFVSPGLAFAANASGGSGGRGFFGASAGWGLGGRTGRLMVSGAAGAQRSGGDSRAGYGGRVAANVWNSRGGSFGAGAFVGVGGAPRTRSDNVVTNPAILSVPAGISLGYKREMGTTRGLSVYAAPFYAWTRTDSTFVESRGVFAFSAGLDFAFNQSFGVSAGGEFSGGDRGNLFGGAITFVPGRRR